MNRVVVVGLVSLALATACDRTPEDLREWRPSDHHHTTESESQSRGAPQVSGSAEPSMPGLEDVTIATWRTRCAGCHGQLGRGDGPQGPMVKARDLSDPAWQASVTDERIAETITKGRGLMPPSALPKETVENLVHLVRLMNRERREPEPSPASSAPSAAPKGSR
jgi:cytochrome c oxidase cbb3-type subunit 3